MKHIKVTNEDRNLFKEIVKKHGIVKENLVYDLLSKVMGNQIQKALDNNKDLQQALKDTDTELDKAREIVNGMIKRGLTPPEFMRKYASPELRAMIGKFKDYEKNPAKYNYILDK
jgi:hypothetical protein